MEGATQLSIETGRQDKPTPAGESRYDAIPRRVPDLERWHVPLCVSIAKDLRDRAEGLQASKHRGDWQLAQADRDRVVLWNGLADRIDAYLQPDEWRPSFSARDVELIRWFRLVQLRQLYKGRSARELFDQRCRQADHLFHAVIARLPIRERAKVNPEMLP